MCTAIFRRVTIAFTPYTLHFTPYTPIYRVDKRWISGGSIEIVLRYQYVTLLLDVLR